MKNLKDELIKEVETALEKLDGSNKSIIKDLLKWLNNTSNLYCHFIDNQMVYLWLVDNGYIKKSLISEIWGRG